jgi:hypothetical protein
MTHATHTPGPWNVSQPSGNYIQAPTGGIAALTYGASKADAHLIAAAPDMLAALEALLDDALALGLADSHLSGSAIEARTAITKAKGN